jgi:hypothetical protein
MTRISRDGAAALAEHNEIERIAGDLRRQREELARTQRSSTASAAETAQLVERITKLRRRMLRRANEDED